MTGTCRFLESGVCRHATIGPAIVYAHDCEACIAFDGRESPELTALTEYRKQIDTIDPPNAIGRCRHLGTKLKVAECCGQMYACKLHKGKKCAIVGIAKEPFLSCQACDDFDSIDKITPTIIDRDRFVGRCVAVTSLSPNPERAERQAYCLQSWRDIGLPVIAVNTTGEHAGFSGDIRHRITAVVNDSVSTEHGRPTQRIRSLLDAGSATGLPFLLINADVEIYGDHELLERAIASHDKLTIGIRYNHEQETSRGASQREAFGLDAFLLTPAMAATVPDLPFAIGMPVWDYWIPQHFRTRGHEFNWIDQPLFFHERHELQWSVKDWDRGGEWLMREYNLPPDYNFVGFRKSLNEAPSKASGPS